MNKPIRVAISVGDINGIGPEIILKTFRDKAMLEFFTPIIFGSVKVLNHHSKTFSEETIFLNGVREASQAIDGKINVVNLWREMPEMNLGKATETGGKYAYESLKSATEAVKSKAADVLVTAPINKDNIQSEEFRFPGHTEYLAAMWGGDSRMLMCSDQLRVGMLTQHIPLKDVAQSLSKEKVLNLITDLNTIFKKDFSILKPKIAVLGLNPHAGDNGLLGKEDQEIIQPAIQQAFEKGIYAFGPYSADSFFTPNRLAEVDVTLAMYHDQALIPFKTISFGEGVNFTAGLPFVRTSPDHGVAYDLAGKNEADEASFREALFMARDIFLRRTENHDLMDNALKIRKPIPYRGKRKSSPRA